VLGGPNDVDGLVVSKVPLRRHQGSSLRYLFEYGVFFVISLFWITWHVIRSRPDLVFVNSPPDAFVLSGVAAKLRGVPLVLDVHDPMPELLVAKGGRSRLLRTLLEVQERWSLRFADRVITVHEPLRRLLHERSPDVPIDVVMNVPDAGDWEPIERDPESRLLVFAGTVAYRYGLDDVLEAMELLDGQIPDLRFRVIGDGEDMDRLAVLVRDKGLDRDIDFKGRVPYAEVIEAQAGAWAGVNVPKPDELGELSLSNKIVEWVAMRLPVVASRTSTLEAYFPEGTLIYVKPGSPEEIASGLQRLHQLDEEQVGAMLDRAEAALARIAWPVQRAALLGVIKSVVVGY
jgi:glycosyltransferase involved in cell wall biosynthesis